MMLAGASWKAAVDLHVRLTAPAHAEGTEKFEFYRFDAGTVQRDRA